MQVLKTQVRVRKGGKRKYGKRKYRIPVNTNCGDYNGTANCLSNEYHPALVSRPTGWSKMAPFLYALTLPNVNRFSKLFHCRNQEKIVY